MSSKSVKSARGRTVAFVACAIAFAWVVLAYLPVPSWSLWLAHMVALETSLMASVLAVGGVLLLRPWRWAQLSHRYRVVVGCLTACTILGAVPLLRNISVLRAHEVGFSPLEYFTGQVTAAVDVKRDVALVSSRPELTVDVYSTESDAPRPFVIAVHGGGWQRGDKGEATQLSRVLANSGYAVFDVRYRLAPEHPFPAAITDVKCILGTVRAQSDRWKIDVARAAYIGRSAGAQIAATAAYSVGSPDLKPSCDVDDVAVQGMVGLYGAYELAYGYDNPAVPNVANTNESLRRYLGGSPSDVAARYRRATPSTWLTAGANAPPTLLIHGRADGVVRAEHSSMLGDALASKGVDHHVVLLHHVEHGFAQRPGGIGDQVARTAIVRFLNDKLRAR